MTGSRGDDVAIEDTAGTAREASATQKTSIIRWRGLLAKSDLRIRLMAFAALMVFAAAMTFMQLGFVGVGEEGDYHGYMVALLAPISLGALLLGVWMGTLLGLVSGAILYLHAHLQPLDYYEISFVTPLSSVAMLAVAAFFTGLFLAVALRKDPPPVRRVVYIALVCVFCSIMFTISFSINMFVETFTALISMTVDAGGELDEATIRAFVATRIGHMGSPDVQILFDALAMLVACIAGDFAVRYISARKGSFSLRTTFRAWLLLMLSMAWVIVASLSFAAITEHAKSDVAAGMHEEIDYLLIQLENRNGDVGGILDGYSTPKEGDGTIVIFQGDKVVGSDDAAFKPGTSIADYIDVEGSLAAMLNGTTKGQQPVQVLYDANITTVDDVQNLDLRVLEDVAIQVVYRCFDSNGDFTVMMQMPSGQVFEDRNATMVWVALSALVLLGATFVLTSRLLSRTVARRIERTNGTLARITEGDLSARADVRDNPEFASLTDGINSTVDALQGWITEAENRMASELAAAKAIQESTLPRTFPPFPDISRFGIYASMDPAREVGGDFYDFFLVGGECSAEAGRLCFCVADVSGKGIPAALFMMAAKREIRGFVELGMDLGEAVACANDKLCEGNDAGMFVTAFVGVLDYATGHVTYTSAGHNPPLVRRSGVWEWVMDKSGLPLGLFDGMPYTVFELDLADGDALLLYTDGVTEAMSATDELYGEERLIGLAREKGAIGPEELVGVVRSDVALHAEGAEQSDDITVLALEFGDGR